jgi:hypothetical protein
MGDALPGSHARGEGTIISPRAICSLGLPKERHGSCQGRGVHNDISIKNAFVATPNSMR